MKNELSQTAVKLNKERKRKRHWKDAVKVMAVMVVFITTYLLILPAITLNGEPSCGIEAHVHGEECYAQQVILELQCGLSEKQILHSHDAFCYDAQGLLRCTLTERQAHQHAESCYVQTSSEIPTCAFVHNHDLQCTAAQFTLICTMEEGKAHKHDLECYALQEQSCELTTDDGHVHDESCYEQFTILVCGIAELHIHGEGCYDAAGILSCEQMQAVSHQHSEACLVEVEQEEQILICELPEHSHEELCYPAEETEADDSPYLCASGEHFHTETCYDTEGALLCSIPEHSHEAACMVAELDLTADVETAQQWEAAFAELSLTGNWPADTLRIAQTQLDYQESQRNVILVDGGLKGYTRYGQWYGDAYGDWCAMFVSFCLHYAQAEDFPLESGCGRWITALKEQELYLTPDTYTPKPGDVIFFDFQQKRDAPVEIPVEVDHVGLVAELIPATEETPAMLKTIEGNSSDMVTYRIYEMDDPAIIGYGAVPAGKTMTLEQRGEDYTVTVTFGKEAGIPETAQLSVREILPETEEYESYYRQSLDALQSSSSEDNENALAVSFARFFDISFLVDGQIVEPTAMVNVQISYANPVLQKEEESGVAVHFTQGGVEVIDAQTSQAEASEGAHIDTFEFAQDSFSVVGTVISNYTRSIGVTSATPVNFDALNASGNAQYVIYTEYNGRYYALTSWEGDAVGHSIPLTMNADGTISWETADSRIFWSFTRNGNTGSSYYVQNYASGRYLHAFDNSTGTNADYGTVTGGRNASALTLNWTTGAFTAQGNRYYTGLVDTSGAITFNRVANASQAAQFRLALVGEFYNVWFDGTNGGMMSYYGSPDRNIPAVMQEGATTISLPETWDSPTKYPYRLQGWYDIITQTYYPVNPNDGVEATAQIRSDTVFYADWVAATYDVGEYNEHVVQSLDTDNFITTYVFDYNVLFNVLSQSHTGSISATEHNETWTVVTNGKVPYENKDSLNFVMVDYDSNGDFSYANNRGTHNTNQGLAITPELVPRQDSESEVLKLLFRHDVPSIGKNFVGYGNYLFQYMDSTTENYDGEHDGYYYLDARYNAAAYNQTAQRFYLYDYLVRTSDSRKDGGSGEYSDFLPFNSIYLFEEDQMEYYENRIRVPGYEFDAKDAYTQNGIVYSSTDDAATNYFFGIRSDIRFFLPNDSGTQDEYGNYGNISTRGEHMIFEFHGDDDLWVYIDGELLLDVGGLHGVMVGEIDFSTGQVYYGAEGGDITVKSFEEILGHGIREGTHNMTVYYMERGSSQSNCSIYFNIAPRYDLEITKEDIVSAELLDGAVFTIYNDEAMTSPAQLWDSYEAYSEDMADGQIDNAKSSFAVVNGIAKCWGISAGKTYYIYETTPPPGYPESDDIIRITLNNRGTATIETTTLHGPNEIATEGFAVIKQDVNDTLKIVALTVTNQKEGDTTEVRVEKTWAEGSVDLPQSITVYLTADGVPVGRTAVLHEGNGWSYTWTGLQKYADEGIDREIVYVVEEVLVPDYITTQGDTVKVENYVDWIRVDQMSDSKTYILVHDDQALTYDQNGFGWMETTSAELDSSLSAQWWVTTDHDGFHLKNGLGYTLTFHPSTHSFYGDQDDAVALNQVFYYLNSRLVVHDHDVYYQFGSNGSAVAQDGLAFTLYQKEVLTGFLTNIINVPVQEEDQTFVEVTKVWQDGNEKYSGMSVTIRLLADGKDTGRTIVLNEANNWSGGFYDLPYYQEDGETVVQYTVVEVPVYNFVASYSEPVILDALPVSLWSITSDLTYDQIYRIATGSYALAVDGETVTAVLSDSADTHQQWETVRYNNSIVLRNVATQRYLTSSGATFGTTTSQSRAAAVTLTNGYIMMGNMYLEIGAGYAVATNNSANITDLKVYRFVHTTGMPGAGYTVTNSPAVQHLPETGSDHPHIYTYGGLLILALAFVYLCMLRRKPQERGSDRA